MAYFDHNATTPLSATARAAWLEAQKDAWQNPGAAYRSSARVRALLDRERERLAALLGGTPDRLIFTSGATEAANTVLAHLAGRTAAPARILSNPTEHSCGRLAAERFWAGRGEMLPVDAAGRVAVAEVQARLAAGGIGAVAVMAANNETGVLQPWREIAVLCRERGVPFICDAAQWLGKLPASGLGAADFVFASAHKFGGPKGAGLLLLPEGAAGRDFASLVGGGQQAGRRAGTEDWPAVAAMSAALHEAETVHILGGGGRQAWRDEFERELVSAIPGARVVGAGAERLWNTVMAVVPVGESQRWLTKLDRRDWQVSTTAACAAAQGRSSAVLATLGVPDAEARRALRFSAGWSTTAADWRGLLEALVAVHGELANVV